MVDGERVHLQVGDVGSFYDLASIEETHDEVIVNLGATEGAHGAIPSVGDNPPEPIGYQLPELQDEIARLKDRWVAVGLSAQEFDAWAAGSDYEHHLYAIRRKLREVGG